jgi:acetoacetyl-CoA synthetase
METVPEVGDSLVVHLEDPAGGAGRLLLFVTVPDTTLDDDLTARIRTGLREALSPRHVPDEILQVPAIPYNRTGKKLEVPVKRILQGKPVDEAASRESLADPTSLDAFEQLR